MTQSARTPLVCVRPPGWIGPRARGLHELFEWVEQAEQLGFDGVFVGDRMLAEAAQDGATVYGASMIDVTVVLAAIAARTRRILIGPLVLVFPYRHPIQLAKTLASLDVASNGRVVVGAGLGWNTKEFAALGIPMAGRAARFEESLSIVRELWRGEVISHDGPNWPFQDVRISPVPVQRRGPPIWLASFSPGQPLDWSSPSPGALRQLDRVGRLADGWVPLIYSASSKRRLDPRALAWAWQLVCESAERHGRQRADIDFVFSDWCYVLDGPGSRDKCEAALAGFFHGSWEDAVRTYTIGTRDEVVGQIHAHTAGINMVDHYVLTPLADDPRQLELLTGVADLLRPDQALSRASWPRLTSSPTIPAS